MDIAVDMAAPAVEWAPVARTMMEQLSAPEQAAVQAPIARLAQDFDASGVTEIRPARPGQQPFFVLRATPALRVFFVRTAGCLRVLDVVGAEQKDILPFVRRARHLAAAFGFANRALGAPDLLAIERPLFGSFRCDVAVGSAAARQFTLVELEDASETSVFEAVKGRDYPRWSGRFERGFSQLVDWAWRIDHERQPSATLDAAFGTPDPRIHYLLVIGRDKWIGAAGRARLEWRHLHNGISGQRTTVWTYDDVFSFISDRLAAAEQDAIDLARPGSDPPPNTALSC